MLWHLNVGLDTVHLQATNVMITNACTPFTTTEAATKTYVYRLLVETQMLQFPAVPNESRFHQSSRYACEIADYGCLACYGTDGKHLPTRQQETLKARLAVNMMLQDAEQEHRVVKGVHVIKQQGWNCRNDDLEW